MTGKTLDSVAPLEMNRGTCGGRPCSMQSATNRSKTFVSSARSSAAGRGMGGICVHERGNAIDSVRSVADGDPTGACEPGSIMDNPALSCARVSVDA